MTAAELIEKLKEFPPDREIIIIGDTIADMETPADYTISFYPPINNLKARFRIWRSDTGRYYPAVALSITYKD